MWVSWGETKQWLAPQSPRELSFPCRLSSLKHLYAIILNVMLIITLLCKFQDDNKLRRKAPSKFIVFLNSRRHLEIIIDADCRGQMGVVGFREGALSLEYQCRSNDLRNKEADCWLPKDTILPWPSSTDFHHSHPKFTQKISKSLFLHTLQKGIFPVSLSILHEVLRWVCWAELSSKTLTEWLFTYYNLISFASTITS